MGRHVFPVAIHAHSAAAEVDWRSDYDAVTYEVIDCPAEVDRLTTAGVPVLVAGARLVDRRAAVAAHAGNERGHHNLATARRYLQHPHVPDERGVASPPVGGAVA